MSILEHETSDILAAMQLRLMRFDKRLIINSLKVACYSSKERKNKQFVTKNNDNSILGFIWWPAPERESVV